MMANKQMKTLTIGSSTYDIVDAEARSQKVDKIEGKGLSTNDYDNIEKQKVSDTYNEINNLKSDLANKLPKSPNNWEAWTAEEQAVAREKMGVDVIEDKLDVLWKLNEGISYDFVTDSTEGYTKTVPSGGKYAAIELIGGKTVVWNQLVNHDIIAPTPVTSNGVTWTYNGDGSYTLTGTITGTYSTLNVIQNSFSNVGCLIVGHKYLYNLSSKNITATSTNDIFTISEIGDNPRIYMQISGRTTGDEINEKITPRFIDLTLMFGEGNEPTSTNDECIKWIEQYAKVHPEHNAGELVSADVESVVDRGQNLFDKSTAIQNKYITPSGEIGEAKNFYLSDYISCRDFTDVSISKGGGIVWYGDDGSVLGFVGGKSAAIFQTYTKPSGAVKFQFDMPGQILDDHSTIMCVSGVYTENTIPSFTPYKKPTTYTIPAAVRNLPGYGWSAGSVYNGIERTENGWQYVQRVDRIDMTDISYSRTLITNNYWFYCSLSNLMSLPKFVGFCINAKYGLSKRNVYFAYTDKSYFIGNNQQAPVIYIRDDSYTDADTFKTAMQGVILYYELAEPVITDITDLMMDFPKNFEVEAGGTITFNNTVELPVPNTVKYLRALAEVEVSV